MKTETIHQYSLSNQLGKGKAASRTGDSVPKSVSFKMHTAFAVRINSQKSDFALKLTDILLHATLNKEIMHY